MRGIKNVQYCVAASIGLVTFLVYLPALWNGFVNWDDPAYILDNPHIRSLDLALFKWAFFDFHASNWHPLTWISHALDYAVWGLNPLGHHLTNIILHTVNTFLVVLAAAALFKAAKNGMSPENGTDSREDLSILAASGLTGLLFGLHPVHVESVAWIAERKDVLCGMFFLLSILQYSSYAGGAGTTPGSALRDRRYRAALGFFVLALLSKPMAVTLPLVLLILDWHPFHRIVSRRTLLSACREKLPFAAASILSAFLTLLAQKSGSAIWDAVPLRMRLLIAAKSVLAYIAKIMLPFDLVPFYPHPRTAAVFSIEYGGAAIFVLAISVICIRASRKYPILAAVWCYYLVTLLPVIGIVQVGGQAMADRYTYLPGLGLFLLAGTAAARLWSRIGPGRIVLGLSTGVLISVFAALSFLTVKQTGIWENDMTLWNYTIEKNPEGVPMAYNNRGMVFYKLGRLDRALADFEKAASLNPRYAEAYNNGAMVLDDMGLLDRAIEYYDRALSLNPSYYKAYNNKGTLYGKQGLFDKAIENLDHAIRLNPQYADAYYNLGITHTAAGQYESALHDFNRALALKPENAAAYLNRGKIFARTGRNDLAQSDFGKACSMGISEGCSSMLEDLRR